MLAFNLKMKQPLSLLHVQISNALIFYVYQIPENVCITDDNISWIRVLYSDCAKFRAVQSYGGVLWRICYQ